MLGVSLNLVSRDILSHDLPHTTDIRPMVCRFLKEVTELTHVEIIEPTMSLWNQSNMTGGQHTSGT